ncbi:MAG: hypothetical protein ACE5IE_04875 [Dehalococcoidia bacterium]
MNALDIRFLKPIPCFSGLDIAKLESIKSFFSERLKKEAFILQVDSFAAVAAYLAEAKEGKGSLFIQEGR